ncbi:MAG: phosphoglycerate kinase [Candidatus Thorarchaeota archaeon]|nr:phosphoglycerate kinase [Candidatus Thorarchaeota archaeon]
MVELPFKTLDDIDYEGKRVLIRVDMNCSLDPDTKRITDDSRIIASLPTLKELSKSKVALMAHQGRPGSSDFISLKQHTERMKELGLKATFVDDIFGEKAKTAIKNLKDGEIVVLENVRMFEGELKKAPPHEVAETALVQELYHLFDFFVNDAYGAAHRSQASTVGFTTVLPSAAGRLVEKEIRILTEATAEEKHPWILVLGGAKVEDKVKTLSRLLETGRVDYALLGGLMATLFLIASDSIPEEYSKPIKGFENAVDLAKTLLNKYPEIIRLPSDAAIERDGGRVECALSEMNGNPFFDIGPETIEMYMDLIEKAAVVFANGPMGFFERKGFDIGTIKILNAIAECKGTTIVGGGHMGAVAIQTGQEDKLSHISTGGGATINFLTGKKLEVIRALEEAAKRMDDLDADT